MSSNSYLSKLDFVEDLSLRIEELGHPRIYGQILGWLLICDPPEQSFQDLMENLEISKASISNITRMMIESGLIEKVRVKGERQIYFKIKDGSLIEFMEKQMELTLSLAKITKKGLDLAESEGVKDTKRLERANEFHNFLAQELPNLINKYRSESKF
jgi:DNA-binding transcriptional regulator GbsR (MarR family)